MKASHPPILATKLLGQLVSGPHGDALAGDLIEQYRQGRSADPRSLDRCSCLCS